MIQRKHEEERDAEPAGAPRERAVVASPGVPVAVLALQRAAGNMAVAAWLAQAPAGALQRDRKLPNEPQRLSDFSSVAKEIDVDTDIPPTTNLGPYFTTARRRDRDGLSVDVRFPQDQDMAAKPTDETNVRRGISNYATAVFRLHGASTGAPLVDQVRLIDLDFSAHGGQAGHYRFTSVARATAMKGGKEVPTEVDVTVERLGAARPRLQAWSSLDAARKLEIENRFVKFGHSRQFMDIRLQGIAEFTDDEYGRMLQAFALLPDPVAGAVRDIIWTRGIAKSGPHGEPGEYEFAPGTPPVRRLTLFGDALTASDDELVKLLAHEIGHAISYVPSEKKGSKATVATSTAYKQAADLDGGLKNAITEYGRTDWEEHYAESYSYFVTEADTLRILRPNVSAWFTRQATPPPPTTTPPKPAKKEPGKVSRVLARDATVVDHTADDKELRGHLAGNDWPGVAGTLERYGDAREQRIRVDWLDVWQTIELAKYLRPGGAGGHRPRALRTVVEDVLRAKLGQVYGPAVKAGNWPLTVALLEACDEPDRVARAREILTAAGTEGVTICRYFAAQRYGNDHVVTRTLDFVPLESQTGAAVRPTEVAPMRPGKAVGPGVAVPGGSVTTYDTATNAMQGPGWFGLSYDGADAPKTGWLAFGTRQAEMYDAKGATLGFETSVTHEIAGQPEKMHWSTPWAPWWHLDTQGDTAPFMEAASSKTNKSGTHDTLPTQTAVWDRPDPSPKIVRAAFKHDGVAKVVERCRIHLYLVRGMDVLYENFVTIEWTSHTATDVPQPKNTAGRGQEITRLLSSHHEALLRRFPEWRFYPHT